MNYEEFLASKAISVPASGFAPRRLPKHLFPFQRHIVKWAVRRGCAAVFADCGLGKTYIQLEWARQMAKHSSGQVLIIAPLAVAAQTIREAERIGLDVGYVHDDSEVGEHQLCITNYERSSRFDMTRFAGVVLDESGILKSYMGKTKQALVESCAKVPYRLACTATPAPNDHVEIGNHAEFLGVMRSHEMISRWFITDLGTFGTYRLKGHAVTSFWDWVASWAICCSVPSDLGYSDDGYVLPPLEVIRHVVDADITSSADGNLFRMPEMSATSVHREKRLTASSRAAKVAELVRAEPGEQWVIWCETDYEADALAAVLPDAIEVRGSHAPERKEQAAVHFVDGKFRILLSKPSIFGWGLNLQCCARQAFMGVTFSYEKFYQAVRRSWRFGQKRPVHAHVVMASTETEVWSILSEKKTGHDEMRTQMSAAMRRAQARESPVQLYAPTEDLRVPAWLTSEVAQ